MKKIIYLFLLLLPIISTAQVEVSSWTINKGQYASYWENANGSPNNPNFVFHTSTTLADVTKVCYDSTYVWVKSEGMTNDMGKFLNPGSPTAQNYTFRFPRVKTVPGTKTEVPLIGAIGVLKNGIPIYGLSNAHYYNGTNNNGMGTGTWNVEVYLSEGFVLDTAFGAHPQQQGAYHTHAKPNRLYANSPITIHSPLIGYAFDGYPVYGPYGYSSPLDATSAVTRMKTGYSLRNITTRTTLPNGQALTSQNYGPAVSTTYPIGTYVEDYEWSAQNNGDLDQYNGRNCVTPEYPNGTYAYFISIDAVGTPQFPYILGTEYYGAPEVDNITIGKVITIPTTGVDCLEPTGINNVKESDVVYNYPNPTNGLFTLSLPDLTGQSQIQISDITGKIIYQVITNDNSIQIDLSGMNYQGVLAIIVTNNNKEYKSKILLK